MSRGLKKDGWEWLGAPIGESAAELIPVEEVRRQRQRRHKCPPLWLLPDEPVRQAAEVTLIRARREGFVRRVANAAEDRAVGVVDEQEASPGGGSARQPNPTQP